MTVSTFFSETSDGWIESDADATYSTARAMGSVTTTTTGTAGLRVGQEDGGGSAFACQEFFVQWDTSALTATAIISAATLSLWGDGDLSDTDFNVEIRLEDWGATLTDADVVAGADLSGKTLITTDSTAGLSTGAYNDLTEQGSALVDNIAKTANTILMGCSAEQTNNSAPSGDERYRFATAEAAGTTNDPKLVVTHIPGVSPPLPHPLSQLTVRGKLLNR